MRKAVVMLMVSLVIVNMIKAQESDPLKSEPLNAIMINPVGILASLTIKDYLDITLSYEHKVLPELSCLIHLNVGNVVTSGDKDKYGYTPAKLNYVGYGILPEIRHYPGCAPYGPFVGLFGKFMIVDQKYYESDILLNTEYGQYAGIGGRVGFKFGWGGYIFEPSVVFGTGKLYGFRKETNTGQALITPNPVEVFWGFEFKYGKMF
jgi:hypothetical protein